MDDWELIKEYVESQSESAFKALVERYAGLVYGSALRQAHDLELAQDIAQAVFILLARKASTFRKETIVSGWLFQTTRFVISRALRREQRRQRREQEAVEMHDLSSADSAWRQMEPIIDTALQELSRADRDALLIRYVEGQSMREVGARLGVTEEAAKKRVSRAVEKLRLILARRGVPITTVLIGSALTAGVNAATPVPVIASIISGMQAVTSGSGGALASEVIQAWRWEKIKAAGGVAATALLIATFVAVPIARKFNKHNGSAMPTVADATAGPTADANVITPNVQRERKAGDRILHLRAVDGLTGAAITNAMVAFTVWWEEKLESHFDLLTDSSGGCDIPYRPETGRLDAGVLAAGWGARFATWPSEGISEIPKEYTLRLERTTNVIGGQILDPNGRALAAAQVWFQAAGTGDYAQRERPRERFGFERAVPLSTDLQGRWRISFVPSIHPGFSIWATHEQFAKTEVISVSDSQLPGEAKTAFDQLWAAQLVTTMKKASTLSGKVVNSQGAPIVGAKIQQREQSELFWTDTEGFFRVPRLLEGKWEFTVSAEGFAPVRTNVDVHSGTESILLSLQPGGALRLRVVDEHGIEVPDATVGLEQWGEYRHVLEWAAKTDRDGRIEWLSAPPDVDLELYGRKDGFCYTRDVRLTADGQEHIIQLRHALDVYGRVFDAQTGYAIREFKVVPGYGYQYHDSEQHWFAGETVAGTNGLFKLTFGEKPPWHLRIMAPGYEDWISAGLETNQRSATLDIPLKRSGWVEGIVLSPDRKPALGAQVALLSLDHNVRLLPRGVFVGDKRWLTTSDSKGGFRFPVNRSAHSIAVVSTEGYAHARVRDFGQMITLQLERWGRVSGTIDVAAKRYPVESIRLYDPAVDNFQGRVALGDYSAKLDGAGRFTFEKVPPGEFSVFINSLRGLSYHHQTPLTVTPGETTEVTIAEQPGVLVKGRLVAGGGATIDWLKDRIILRIERESLRYAPGWNSKDDGKLEAVDYWSSQVAREFVNSRRGTDLDVKEDGSFVSVERVPAGEYLLFAAFKKGSANRQVTISAEQEALPELNIGSVELIGKNR